VSLVPLDRALLDAAEVVEPPGAATLDAIHLATALHLAAAGALDAVTTYGARLAAGATHHGLPVLAPA
jgi:predicted nucleic acid-binding protein